VGNTGRRSFGSRAGGVRRGRVTFLDQEHDYDDCATYFFDDCPTDLFDGVERGIHCLSQAAWCDGLGHGLRLRSRRAADGIGGRIEADWGRGHQLQDTRGASSVRESATEGFRLPRSLRGYIHRVRRVSKLHDSQWRQTADRRVQRCTVGESHPHFVADLQEGLRGVLAAFANDVHDHHFAERLIAFVRYFPPPQQPPLRRN